MGLRRARLAGVILLTVGVIALLLAVRWHPGGHECLVRVRVPAESDLSVSWVRARYPGVHGAGGLNLGEERLLDSVALVGEDGTTYILEEGSEVLVRDALIKPVPLLLVIGVFLMVSGLLLLVQSVLGLRLPQRWDAVLVMSIFIAFTGAALFSVLYPVRPDIGPGDWAYLKIYEARPVSPGLVVVAKGALVTQGRLAVEKVFGLAIRLVVMGFGTLLVGLGSVLVLGDSGEHGKKPVKS